MSTLVAAAAGVEFAGNQHLPRTMKLYQPYEVDQILLTDFANCLSVKAFLKMCKLPFQPELRTNAEFMSPSGRVPFIQADKVIVSEFEPIVTFVANKGQNLSEGLSMEERAEMKAFMALVENNLTNAELWISWCDKKVATEITKPRYGYPFAWPLNVVLPWLKQRQNQALLHHKGWKQKDFAEVCEQVRTCCGALSEKLGESAFFFGNRPTELDALVFGHLYTLLSTPLPTGELADIVCSFPNLSTFCTRVDNVYVKETELHR